MLIYDPALDPYHSAIRILAIAMSSAKRRIELSIDAARIADYFLVYPYKMIGFRFPAEFRTMRAAVKETKNHYRHALGVLSPNPRNFQNGKFSRWPTSNARVMPWRVLL